MFERFSQIAEQAATNLSRRQFLARIGTSAVSVAALLGGLLAAPLTAQARGKTGLPCGDGSVEVCRGHSTGDICREADGYGRCAYFKGTTICGCATLKNGKRR